MGTAVLLVAWAQKQGQENASHPYRLMGAQLVLGKTRKQRIVKKWHVLVCYVCITAYRSKLDLMIDILELLWMKLLIHFIFKAYFYAVSTLRCYVGTGNSKELMDCTSGLDRCIRMTTFNISAYSCNAKRYLGNGINDNACTTISTIETCICSTDGCNGNDGIGNCYVCNFY